MRIGELSRRTGASVRMLRYYESQGLLRARRAANGYREYEADATTVVTQIRGLLAAGLSTEVIRSILPCAHGAEPTLEPCTGVLATLRTELDGIEGRIADLTQSRDALRRYLTAVTAS